MSTWLVVPTRGDHPQLLSGIARLPYPLVVVRTAPCEVPESAHVIDDRGPVNIHRWWNAGLDYAQANGATVAVVLNDDVLVPPDAIGEMVDRLRDAGAWLCGADPTAMTGWAWALDLTAGERPDERFCWWYGDNDLWRRAADAGRLTGVNVGIAHQHPNQATAASPELQRLAAEDMHTYQSKWEAACSPFSC